MTKKTWLVAGILAFVLFIGGAAYLYDALAAKAAPEQLAALNTPSGGTATQAPAAGAADVADAIERTPAPSASATAEETPKVTAGTGAPEATPEPAVTPEPTPAPEKAPDFTVYGRSGAKLKLSDFYGKPIVLNFWASWCGPCKMEMPDFDAVFQERGEEIHFLMVNLTDGRSETPETAADFIDREGYTFPIYFDTDQDAAMTYGVYSIPTTYFLDAEGYGVAMATGAIDRATLERGIEMIADG